MTIVCDVDLNVFTLKRFSVAGRRGQKAWPEGVAGRRGRKAWPEGVVGRRPRGSIRLKKSESATKGRRSALKIGNRAQRKADPPYFGPETHHFGRIFFFLKKKEVQKERSHLLRSQEKP